MLFCTIVHVLKFDKHKIILERICKNNSTQKLVSIKIHPAILIYLFLSPSNGSTVLVPGSDLLSFQGYKTSWLWYDMIGLGGLALLFLTQTYITLRLIKKEK